MTKLLLNPGPTNTREETKNAQHINSDVCHRTDDFKIVLDETKELLLDLFGDTTFNVALLGGSGTVGMEAMISSLVQDDIVVINAGVYGQRAIDMMDVYNIKYIEIRATNIDELEPNKNYIVVRGNDCLYGIKIINVFILWRTKLRQVSISHSMKWSDYIQTLNSLWMPPRLLVHQTIKVFMTGYLGYLSVQTSAYSLRRDLGL